MVASDKGATVCRRGVDAARQRGSGTVRARGGLSHCEKRAGDQALERIRNQQTPILQRIVWSDRRPDKGAPQALCARPALTACGI